MHNMMRRNVGGTPVLFMDVDASKEEEGTAHVIDHARDLCVRARVDDNEFEAVEGDGGGVKRGAMVGHGGGGANLDSTTTIRSSNGNPMATGSNLGLTVFFIFKKIDFWCRLVTADTKNRLFFISHSWYRLQ
jgi:hypothetical protein